MRGLAERLGALFTSMEIEPLRIEQRLLAIQGHLPAKGIDSAGGSAVEPDEEGSVGAGFQQDPIPVVDGNLTSNVSDVYALVRQLKPTLVIIDGA